MDIHVLRERYYLVVAIYETKLYIHTDAHTHIYFIDNMDVVYIYIYISARVLVVVVDICLIRVYISLISARASLPAIYMACSNGWLSNSSYSNSSNI